MPSTTDRQQKFFGWLAHSDTPEAQAKRRETGMSQEQIHDFSFKSKSPAAKAKRSWKLNKGGKG